MKPILFNTDTVRAILDGRKTVTRRVVKPQPVSKLAYICMGHKYGTWAYPGKDAWKYWDDESFRLPDNLPDGEKARRWTPPCHTGDILYVRETWRIWRAHRYDADAHIEFKAGGDGTVLRFPHGCTDSDNRDGYDNFIGKWGVGGKWRPSIHMPREVARIFLRVTGVCAERLQKISIDGMKAEGAGRKNIGSAGCSCAWKTETCMTEPCANRDSYEYLCWAEPFSELWNSTIRPAQRVLYGWGANPWVWVIEFERCEKPEEATM